MRRNNWRGDLTLIKVSLIKRKNGQIRIFEAFLAVLLVSSALIISAKVSTSENVKKDMDLYSLGIQALLQLDQNGKLGELIDGRNWMLLGESLRNALPLGIVFNLTIYDEDGWALNNVVISNGALNLKEVVSIEYICGTQAPECHFYIVRLQLSRLGG
jgi:hypothetical protein